MNRLAIFVLLPVLMIAFVFQIAFLSFYLATPRFEPSGSVRDHLQRGRRAVVYVQEGEETSSDGPRAILSVAEKEFGAALKIDPNNVEALRGKVECLQIRSAGVKGPERDAMYRNEIRLDREILARNPTSDGATDLRGSIADIYRTLGDPVTAIKEYRAVLDQKPVKATADWAYLEMAMTYEEQGRLEEALALYRRLEQDTGHTGRYMNEVIKLRKTIRLKAHR